MDFTQALKPAEEQQNTPPVDPTAADQLNLEGQANTPPADAPPEGTPPPDTQSQTPNNQPPEGAPDANALNQQQINYDKILDEMSGGVIKDTAGFKAALPQIREFATLKQERDDLAAKMAQAPVFADDEVRILNELKAAGASKDQIKSFHQINEYGSLKEIPDRDARIARMVIIDGVKPSVAEKKVDLEFKLNDENLSDDEKEILADDLRVAANNDRKALESFKAQVSQVNQIPAEEAQLQQQAQLLAHQSKVVPYVGEVMASIPNLGVFSLKGADGKEAVKYEVPIDDAIRSQMGQYVQNYFMDGTTDVTPENTRLALNYARAEYFRENAESLLQAAFLKGDGLATERLTAKYENRSGLRSPEDNPIIPGANNAAATAEFARQVANRTT